MLTVSDLQSIIELFGFGLVGGIAGGMAFFVISLFVNMFYGIINQG